jgi:hypothetical protein
MEWISVNKQLPETHSQHGRVWLSDKVGIWTDEGFDADQYYRKYDSEHYNLIEEGWVNSQNVTHWFPVDYQSRPINSTT